METHQGLSRIKLPAITTIIAILFCFCSIGAAQAAVQDGLVGANPGFPQITAPGSQGQQCTYDSGTQTLTITAIAQAYLSDANSFEFINNGIMTLTAMIDNAGNLTGGTLTVSGTTNSGLTDPLLTGDLVALGMEDAGATDQGDFRATPSGGSVLNGPDWPGNFDITASLTLGNSTYSDVFNANWGCDEAGATLGAENFAPPVVEDIEVEVVVNPDNVGECININGKGGVPVAILGHTVDISMVDRDSLVFQGLDEKVCTVTDVNDDNIDDLSCAFVDDTSKWMAPVGGEGTLSGQLFNGTVIFGSGGICLVSGSSAVGPVLLVLLSLIALFRRRLRIS